MGGGGNLDLGGGGGGRGEIPVSPPLYETLVTNAYHPTGNKDDTKSDFMGWHIYYKTSTAHTI